MTSEETRPEADWPLRAPIYAAIGAAGALVVAVLSDGVGTTAPVAESAIVFVLVATLFLLTTLERVRALWSLAAAAGWGAVVAFAGWFTARYNAGGEVVDYPFLAALLAVVIAAPLFQGMRDRGHWTLDDPALHRHAWTDAVIVGASFLFMLLSWGLAWLVAALFDAIGLSALKDLMGEKLFVAPLLGAAFGGAMAVLRDRERLAPTLQRLAIALLRVLAPLLALSLGAFLLAVPATGLSGLWKSGLPETPLMLVAAAFAVVLVNAVIGDGADGADEGNDGDDGDDGDDGAGRGRWRWRSAMLLVATVLPLALIALASMAQRVGQHGWTPDRLWGVVAGGVAVGYGALGLVALARGRWDFDRWLRPLQVRFSLGVCALALLLAMPILDFGRISTASQLARLEQGQVGLRDFDWRAMAFDFGPSGRAALKRIAAGPDADRRRLAAAALAATNRWDIAPELDAALAGHDLEQRLRVLPEGAAIDPALRSAIIRDAACRSGPCVVILGQGEAFLVGNPYEKKRKTVTRLLARPGGWEQAPDSSDWPDNAADLGTAPIEVRIVSRRQIFVDGKPVGPDFE